MSIIVTKTLRTISWIIVIAVIVWGFMLVGTPSYNRKRSADRNSIEDLKQLSRGIEDYHEKHKKLPMALHDLESLDLWYIDELHFSDPVAERPYEYTPTSAHSYTLCTTFNLSSEESDLEENLEYYRQGRRWIHPAGRHCFQFEVRDSEKAPYRSDIEIMPYTSSR